MSHSNLNSEDYNWVKAALDGPHFQRTTAITIALSLDISDPRSPIAHSWDIEPPPHIDYWLVHSMIRLSDRALTDLDKKRYDYLSAVRKAYYTAHCRFQHAYHGLADAQAYERILDAERSEMCAFGERRQGQWADSERQKELNAKELVRRLEGVQKAAELRKAVTAFLSREKRAFLERDVHRLAFLCRHAHGQWNVSASTAEKPATVTADSPPPSTAGPRKHPTKYKFHLPTRPIAPRVEGPNDQHEHATAGHTSTDEESSRAQETSDSDRCPDCVRDETAERRKITGAGGTTSKQAVTSSSGTVKRTYSDMIGDWPDPDVA